MYIFDLYIYKSKTFLDLLLGSLMILSSPIV